MNKNSAPSFFSPRSLSLRFFLLLIVTLIELLSHSAQASKQVLVMGSDSIFSNTTTPEFCRITGPNGFSSTEDNFLQIAAASGVLRSLRVQLDGAPGTAGDSYIFTVRVQKVDTNVTCTISGTGTTCENVTNTASISAGDEVSISKTLTGTPTATSASISLVFDGTVPRQSLLPSGSGSDTLATATSSKEYFAVFSSSLNNLTEFYREGLIPTSGTIKSLYVRLTTAPGAGKIRTFTLRKNGTNTSLTCDIINTNTTCSDVATSVSVAAADSVTLESLVATGAAAASTARFGYVFEADVDGEFIWGHSGAIGSNTTLQQFKSVYKPTNGDFSLASDVDMLAQYAYVRKIYLESNVAPGTAGSGKKYTVALNINGTNSTQTCALVETETTKSCTFAPEIALAAYDLIANSITPSATPTTAVIHVSYLVYVPPRRVTIIE